MASVIAAIVTTAVIGLPLVLAADRRARGAGLLGLSYLYGAGLVWAVLFLLSLLHIAWSALTAIIVLLLCFAAAWAFVAMRHVQQLPQEETLPPARFAVATRVADAATAYTVVTFAIYSTIARVWEWDFWAIWGLKGRVFLEAGGVDWKFLRSPFNDFSHPDYPLLLPLNYAWTALIGGGWDDRWMGLAGVAFSAAVLLVIRSLASREGGAFAASLLTLAATAFVLSRYVGLAEGPFIAYAVAGVLFAHRFLLTSDAAALRHSAILLGLAASTKNEGLALMVCVAIAMIATGRGLRASSPHAAGHPARPLPSSQNEVAGLEARRHAGWKPAILGLWPAVAIAAPWLVARALLHLSTDIARGSYLSRVLERLPDTWSIFRLLLQWLPDGWMWLLMLAGLLLLRSARRYRFVLTVVTLQLALYVAAYFGSPHDVAWHIETSWPRVARHLAAPLLYAVMLGLAWNFRRGETLAHAEARSEHL